MTTRTRCADCTHFDHHTVASNDGKRLGQEPCFFTDSTQIDGFCPCPKFKEAKNAAEFADSILGPAPTPDDRLRRWRAANGIGNNGMTEEDGFGPRD